MAGNSSNSQPRQNNVGRTGNNTANNNIRDLPASTAASEQSVISGNSSIDRSSVRARAGSSFGGHLVDGAASQTTTTTYQPQNHQDLSTSTSSKFSPIAAEHVAGEYHSPWEILLDVKIVSPSPNRNYHQLLVMKYGEVRYRVWQISHNAHGQQKPTDTVMKFDDFMSRDGLQEEIEKTFGKHVLEYAKQLCTGRIDYLTRLEERPMTALLQMLSYNDIVQLALSGSRMAEAIQKCEAFWKKAYCKHANEEVTRTVEEIAKRMTWRKLFMSAGLHTNMQNGITPITANNKHTKSVSSLAGPRKKS